MDVRTTTEKNEATEAIRTSIQNLIRQKNLSPEDLKDDCYTISSQFKKMEAPKYLKAVIEKIAYDDPIHFLTIINTIIQSIQGQSVLESTNTDPTFKAVSEIITQIKNKLKIVQRMKDTNIKEVTEFLTFITKPLLELKKINKTKKNSSVKGLDSDCQELITWLDALYLHFSIVIHRKEWQQMTQAENHLGMEKVPHPVKERNTLISLAEKNLLENLSKADVKEVQALILMVLHEVKRKSIAIEVTKEVASSIEYCLKVFIDENEALNKSYFEQVKELTESKDKIIPNLGQFLLDLKKFPRNPEFFEIYKELAFLLEVKYYEAYKDKNSFFSLKNTVIQKQTNNALNIMLIAEYYHLAALILGELTLTKKIVQKDSVQPPVISAPTAPSDKQKFLAKLHEMIADIQDPRRLLILTEITQFVAKMPFEDEPDLFKIIIRAQEALMPQPYVSEYLSINARLTEEAFWGLLDEARESDPQIQLEALLNAISQYELSERQIERLAYLDKVAASNFSIYENNKYLWQKAVGYIPVVASVMDPVLQRANADIVNRILGYFQKENDKHTILQNLFIERVYLLDRSSQEALDIVNKLLLSVYHHLHNLVPISKMQKEDDHIFETYAKIKEQTLFGVENKKEEMLPRQKVQLNG